MKKPLEEFSDDACHEVMNALADRSIGYEDLLEAAWEYHRKSGMPYGESRKGMAYWLVRTTGKTSN